MPMKFNLKMWALCAGAAFSIVASSCGGDSSKSDAVNGGSPDVIVHELSDPDMLNPINYTGASDGFILKNLYQSLLDIDFKTLELVPALAVSRPTIEKVEGGRMNITYEIRPEATWDNGTPITAKDVEFTLKVIKNPKVNNPQNKPYYEFIEDIKMYDDNPRKFTLLCKNVYILAEASSGDYGILPEYHYDPKGLMKGFTIKQLTNEKQSIENDPKIVEFASEFNSEKYQREPKYIVGSGAYKLQEWATGQRVVLVRKEKWWGDNVKDKHLHPFQANAPKITYQTINDLTTALVALKAGNIDVMRSIKPKDFKELPNSDKISKNYNLHTPMQLSYMYFGLNTRLPKFSDKRTRQALAHLCDVDKMIQTVYYGQAKRVIGPVHPSKEKEYNFDIKPYDYNVDKAKQLLAEAGWKDTNGDGTLDNMINGERVEFNIDFTYNSGNDMRKAMALMFQEEARKVGIKVNVLTQAWDVYLERQKAHEFEMYVGAWISTPVPNDHKQIFHTESYNGGSNYVGFGNNASDALIDSIRVELDENKRAAMNKRFQQILHEEAPYIFLFAPTERMAIHKRFSNAEPSVMRPGYWEAGFTVGAATPAVVSSE